MEIHVSRSPQKALVIFGKQGIGKTTLAQKIAEFIAPKATCEGKVFIPDPNYFNAKGLVGKKASRFIFSGCHPACHAIIIDECPKNYPYESFFNFISEGVIVENKGAKPFHILPKFIFVSQSKPKNLGASFNDRLELIELTSIEQLNASLVFV